MTYIHANRDNADVHAKQILEKTQAHVKWDQDKTKTQNYSNQYRVKIHTSKYQDKSKGHIKQNQEKM